MMPWRSVELDADEPGTLDHRLPARGLEGDELIELAHAHRLADETITTSPSSNATCRFISVPSPARAGYF
jgi:hypothetical protein